MKLKRYDDQDIDAILERSDYEEMRRAVFDIEASASKLQSQINRPTSDSPWPREMRYATRAEWIEAVRPVLRKLEGFLYLLHRRLAKIDEHHALNAAFVEACREQLTPSTYDAIMCSITEDANHE